MNSRYVIEIGFNGAGGPEGNVAKSYKLDIESSFVKNIGSDKSLSLALFNTTPPFLKVSNCLCHIVAINNSITPFKGFESTPRNRPSDEMSPIKL